jgi:4-carboxymuconolactone decarboxylase
MGIDPYPTPEERLRALAAGRASVLASLAQQLQSGALERSTLDRETYLLVRLAALVATDAAAVSYPAHLGGPGEEPGLPVPKIIGVFGAIAPLVGSARVLSAASRLDRAGLLPAEPRRITPSG